MMIRVTAILLVLCWATSAQAHLFPKQRATIKVVGNTASLVVAVPVSALKDVDDDRNDMLSPQEIQRHMDSIRNQFVARFHVSLDGEPPTSVLTWVVPPQTDGLRADSGYVVVLHRVRFAVAPSTLTVDTDLFGTNRGESLLTVTATRGAAAEVATLDAATPSHRFSWIEKGDG